MSNEAKQFRLHHGRMVEVVQGETDHFPRFVEAEAHEAVLKELNALRAAFEQPAAWQARFIGQEWGTCSREHHALVLRTPKEWPEYETRELFEKPAVYNHC